MNVLFLGSPFFACKILERLLTSKHQVVACFTQPDRPSGRGHKLMPTEVKRFALENGMKVFDFDKVSKHIDEISLLDYDIAVVAAFGQILSEEFLALKPCINVHPSLLPKYRGATPIESALLSGDSLTGVTIMKVVKKLDAGDIILQQKLKVSDNDNYTSLSAKLAYLGSEMIIQTLDLFQSGKVKYIPQNERHASYCKKIDKDDGLITSFTNAQTIINKSRAFNERGVYTYIDGERVNLGQLRIANYEVKKGEITVIDRRIFFGCEHGTVEIVSLQTKNGKFVSAKDYLNGNSLHGKRISC